MAKLFATRFAAFILTLLAASVVLFMTINVLPGSAAKSALGMEATPQAIARFEAQRGLDRPLVLQYGEWLSKTLSGDFGTSFQNSVPVGPELLKRIPVTLELATLAFLIANLVAIPLGTLMRASMIEVLSSGYIRTAHAKGAKENLVIRRHALRNSLIPYLNVAAVEFGFLFGSAVVIEDIFRLPGVGSLVLVGIINRDFPVLLASALSITVFVLVVNLIVDLTVALLDPRRVKGSQT